MPDEVEDGVEVEAKFDKLSRDEEARRPTQPEPETQQRIRNRNLDQVTAITLRLPRSGNLSQQSGFPWTRKNLSPGTMAPSRGLSARVLTASLGKAMGDFDPRPGGRKVRRSRMILSRCGHMVVDVLDGWMEVWMCISCSH